MTKLTITPLVALLLLLSSLANGQATAADSAQSRLYQSILTADSLLFEAFNRGDLETHQQYFSPELEFYHDQTGLSHYTEVMQNTKNLFERGLGLKRSLIAGSVEVHRIKGYGALQTGQHRFCHEENGQLDCGVFRFIHLWQHTDEGWRLSRVISYDH